MYFKKPVVFPDYMFAVNQDRDERLPSQIWDILTGCFQIAGTLVGESKHCANCSSVW